MIKSVGGDKYGEKEQYERSEGFVEYVRVCLISERYVIVFFWFLETYNSDDAIMEEQ